MKKLLSLDPRLLKKLQQLDKAERVECLLALVELTEAFGQPHRHGGIGIRKLGDRLFECRGSPAPALRTGLHATPYTATMYPLPYVSQETTPGRKA